MTVAALAIAWKWGPAQQGYFDSAFYLDGARHLAAGDGYVSAYAEAGRREYAPVTHWAPGIAVLMAAAIKLGCQPLTAASVVVGGCYVLLVSLVFGLGVALAGARWWFACVLVSLIAALQPSALSWLDAVLSDLPWAGFALLSLGLGWRVMQSDAPSVALRVAWGVSLAWLVWVRYAGLLFLPGLLLAVVLGMRAGGSLWRSAWLLWPTLLTALPGIALWNLRNARVADAPLGGWLFERSDPWTHLGRASVSATTWLQEALDEAAALGLETPMRVVLWAAGLCLLPLTAASMRTNWREVGLVGLSAVGYFAAMVFTASVVLIATLSETRFWIVTWPLSLLFIVTVVGRAQFRWSVAFKLPVVVAMLAVLGVYASRARRDVEQADQLRGLLHPAWAAATEVLPGPDDCYVFVYDPRPLMLHRAFVPMSPVPLSFPELEAAVQRSGPACLALSDKTKRLRLSTTAERRRVEQNAVIEQLKSQGRLERFERRAGVTLYRLR